MAAVAPSNSNSPLDCDSGRGTGSRRHSSRVHPALDHSSRENSDGRLNSPEPRRLSVRRGSFRTSWVMHDEHTQCPSLRRVSLGAVGSTRSLLGDARRNCSTSSLLSAGKKPQPAGLTLKGLWRNAAAIRQRTARMTRAITETIIALFYLFVVPYQIGFESDVVFNAEYAMGYTLDCLLLVTMSSKLLRECRIKALARLAAEGHSFDPVHHLGSTARGISQKERMWLVVMLLLVAPVDALLWMTSAWEAIPLVRLTRFSFALYNAHCDLVLLERSQTFPFSLCRMFRVLSFTLVATHCLACAFFYLSIRPGAKHFSSAPWLANENGRSSAGSTYLRSMYWSFMTYTTAGHVDIVAEHVNVKGQDWEVGIAIVVAVVATLAYIYLNANCTTMMIRLNSQLEQYRAQLAGIDAYLTRNKVSIEVSKRVKKYFVRLQHSSSSADKTVLESLPSNLRNAVLQDIHLRTLNEAPTFHEFQVEVLKQVCAIARTVVFLPEEILCEQGDVVTEMLFLEEGCILETSVREAFDIELRDRKSSRQLWRCAFNKVAGSLPGHESRRESRNMWRHALGAASRVAQASRSRVTADDGEGKPRCFPCSPFARRPTMTKIVQSTERLLTRRGTPMCEVGFLFGLRQEATLDVVVTSHCCAMRKRDFLSLRQQFPAVLDDTRAVVHQRLRQDANPVLADVEASLSKSERRAEQLADVMFAAAAGRLEMIQEVAGRGLNVCEADFEGRTALHIAATSGALPVVQYLLERKANLNATDNFGKTPLAKAVMKGNTAVVKALRDAGAELRWSEAQTASELFGKAREGHAAQLKLLLSCGANVNARDYDRRTCLHLAASEGSLRLCEVLIRHKAEVNASDRWGSTPLHDAIREGQYHVAKMLRYSKGELLLSESQSSSKLSTLTRTGLTERLELLLESGCSVNAADYDGRTCLHLAAAAGNLPTAERLLLMGADVNAIDRWGTTPLHNSVREGHMKVANALSSAGGRLGVSESIMSTELCELARQGSLEKIKIFLACGVNVDCADYDRRTCLHVAAREGAVHVVELLLRNKADANRRDRWGSTPLSEAVREKHNKAAALIIEHGGQLGVDDVRLGQELCYLARKGKLDHLEALLRSGANPNAADYDGRTALHVAALRGNIALVEALLELGCSAEMRDRYGKSPRQEAESAGHRWPESLWEVRPPLNK